MNIKYRNRRKKYELTIVVMLKSVIKCQVPVFLPFLKNSQLHLFSLNGHEPELRYEFRTMLSKIIVTKFSYKVSFTKLYFVNKFISC